MDVSAAPPAGAPARTRLPDERAAVTRAFAFVDAAGEAHKLYAIAGLYPDGRVGELFFRMDAVGTLARGLLDAVAVAVSIGLQHGVPLDAYVNKMVGTRFEPTGFLDGRRVGSVLDLVGRWLGARFLGRGGPPRSDE